jgi:hypothetical protein
MPKKKAVVEEAQQLPPEIELTGEVAKRTIKLNNQINTLQSASKAMKPGILRALVEMRIHRTQIKLWHEVYTEYPELNTFRLGFSVKGNKAAIGPIC